jgi:hypothetical protein
MFMAVTGPAVRIFLPGPQNPPILFIILASSSVCQFQTDEFSSSFLGQNCANSIFYPGLSLYKNGIRDIIMRKTAVRQGGAALPETGDPALRFRRPPQKLFRNNLETRRR